VRKTFIRIELYGELLVAGENALEIAMLARTKTLLETLTEEERGPDDGDDEGAYDKSPHDCGEVTSGVMKHPRLLFS
jgi:hypothetical protein